jgi:hypothetical protein
MLSLENPKCRESENLQQVLLVFETVVTPHPLNNQTTEFTGIFPLYLYILLLLPHLESSLILTTSLTPLAYKTLSRPIWRLEPFFF